MFPQEVGDCPAAPPQLLTLTQAVGHLPVPVSRATIATWVRDGIRGHRLRATRVGGRLFVDPRDLAAFVEILEG